MVLYKQLLVAGLVLQTRRFEPLGVGKASPLSR